VGEQDRGHVPAPDFDEFFARHERPLYAYLRRLLQNEEVAVEIAQEPFIRAWTRFAEIQHYELPQAWLSRVATNLAISALRRRQPAPLSQLLGRWREDEDYGESHESRKISCADTQDLEGQTAQRDTIARVLRHLRERERAALLLRAVHGFSHEEVAETLGVSLSNARQILARARQRFRRLYDAEQAHERV
jgi:RNA polymerase sigma-70 factor (ECF subfamily)